jgi:hypothetical protein
MEYYGRFTPSALEPIYRHVNLTAALGATKI